MRKRDYVTGALEHLGSHCPRGAPRPRSFSWRRTMDISAPCRRSLPDDSYDTICTRGDGSRVAKFRSLESAEGHAPRSAGRSSRCSRPQRGRSSARSATPCRGLSSLDDVWRRCMRLQQAHRLPTAILVPSASQDGDASFHRVRRRPRASVAICDTHCCRMNRPKHRVHLLVDLALLTRVRCVGVAPTLGLSLRHLRQIFLALSETRNSNFMHLEAG